MRNNQTVVFFFVCLFFLIIFIRVKINIHKKRAGKIRKLVEEIGGDDDTVMIW